MAASSDDDDFSESELEYHESKAYNLLKTGGKHKIIKPDGSFRCPFCTNKKKQRNIYKDILQHASGIGASNARSFSQKAKHLAFARFLRSDIPSSSNIAAAAPSPPSGNSSTSPQPRPQGEDHFVGDAEGASAYGWMAGEDDCNSEGHVADVLRTNGRLRTVSDLIEEEREWKSKVAMLADQIEVKNERLLDMESRYNAATISIQRIMEDIDKIKLKHMEEMRRLQRESYENSLRVFRENEMLKTE